jgi:hypothetical protein
MPIPRTDPFIQNADIAGAVASMTEDDPGVECERATHNTLG